MARKLGDAESSGDAIEHDAATAETPLLGGQAEWAGNDAVDPGSLYRQNVILLSLILGFLIPLGAGLLNPAASAIMEDIICRARHPGVVNSVLSSDPLCKSPDVQGDLAFFMGWSSTLDCVPGLISAVPYGILSDKWGRRPILALSLAGITLSVGAKLIVLRFPDILPVWMVLLTSALQLIGGSVTVTQAMLYTYLADVFPVAERATAFFWVMSTAAFASMVASPMAGLMMHRSVWLPALVGEAMLVLLTAMSLAFPETLELKKLRDQLKAQDGQDLIDDNVTNAKGGLSWQGAARSVHENLIEVWEFILNNKRIVLLMASLLFSTLAKFVTEFILQYTTNRFGWGWDKAAIFLTVNGACKLAMLTVVLPAASWWSTDKLKMSVMAKDIWLSRITGVIQICGALMAAVAPNAALFAFSLIFLEFGSGVSSLIRSLMNALVEEHHIGILNSLTGVMESVGTMIAGPLFSRVLRLGFDMGGQWMGLPFLCAALLFAAANLIVWSFRLPASPQLV